MATPNRHDRVRYRDQHATFLGTVWHDTALVVFDGDDHLSEVDLDQLEPAAEQVHHATEAEARDDGDGDG
jgi:hypothetical protein